MRSNDIYIDVSISPRYNLSARSSKLDNKIIIMLNFNCTLDTSPISIGNALAKKAFFLPSKDRRDKYTEPILDNSRKDNLFFLGLLHYYLPLEHLVCFFFFFCNALAVGVESVLYCYNESCSFPPLSLSLSLLTFVIVPAFILGVLHGYFSPHHCYFRGTGHRAS